jgi:DNA polymerase III delta prime subunit
MTLNTLKIKRITKLEKKARVYDLSVDETHNFFVGKRKVLTSNCDGLSSEGMRALRNVMEEYSGNTRFILTANYKHKIITPIQSRCQTLNFDHSIKDVAKHCFNILQKEKISIPSDQIANFQTLIKANFPDFRRILNDLQKYSISGVLDIKYSSISDKFMEEIFQKLTKDDICDVRKFIISNEAVFQSDYHNLMKSLLNYLYSSNLESSKRREAMLIITEYMYRHAFVSDIEINAFACMISLSKLLLS